MLLVWAGNNVRKVPTKEIRPKDDLIKTYLDLDICVVLVYVDGLMVFKSL